ncbi:MAG: glycosyltransferase family 4 protein [Chloroflexota bacterium]|nr:glycosyltransferase family 4 protein [Chloroflexota bacterium]
MDPLRLAIVAPPLLSVPPRSYAGTERMVAVLVNELCRRGHEVTLFAAGDSQVECELVPVVPRSLWSTGYRGHVAPFINLAAGMVWRRHAEFDVIHSHVEALGFLFARHCPTPVLTTLHGRLDSDGTPLLLNEFSDIPLVAISDSQRRWFPDANWVARIHHGLDLAPMPSSDQPGDYLAFVGRVTPEKGVREAIELARRVGLRLRMVAKVYSETEQAHYDEVVAPALRQGIVEFLGELKPLERDPVMAGARATLMLGGWPEPFGLVAVESMATGTPVVARRAGALTETVEHGRTGFLVDDLTEAELAVELSARLDRRAIRQRALERFSATRMVDEYEAVYARLLAGEIGRPADVKRHAEHPTTATLAPVASIAAGSRRRARRG